MNFEANLKRLDEINNTLKNEETSLTDSMKLFEESVKLAGECQKFLETCKGKISKVDINSLNIK